MDTTLRRNVLTLSGRMDTTTIDEQKRRLEALITEDKTVLNVIDASELEYISSIGLRFFLQLAKHCNLLIINVSEEVYQIFEMTGFTKLMTIRRRPREISLEGLQFLAAGSAGEVYRLDGENIVKLCYEGIPQEKVEEELEIGKQAFLAGIPTVIAFDTVRCGDRFGMVYELVDAKTLGQSIRDDPEHLDMWTDLFVSLVRETGRTKVDADEFPSAKSIWMDWYRSLCVLENKGQKILSPERAELTRRVIESIPDDCFFIQNDCTPANIMCQNGESVLIDMGDASWGHPLMELAMTLVPFVDLPVKEIFEPLTSGIPFGLRERIAEDIYRKYFDWASEEELREIIPAMDVLVAIRGAITLGRGIGPRLFGTIADMVDGWYSRIEYRSCQEILDSLDKLYAMNKATPHNSAAASAVPFPPSASCKNLD